MNYPHESEDERKRYQAECDLRVLVDAQKIRGDKARVAAAMKIADEQRAALDKVKKGKSDGK
jgi:hypothetical protein